MYQWIKLNEHPELLEETEVGFPQSGASLLRFMRKVYVLESSRRKVFLNGMSFSMKKVQSLEEQVSSKMTSTTVQI